MFKRIKIKIRKLIWAPSILPPAISHTHICLCVYSSELFYPCTGSHHITVIQNYPIPTEAATGFLFMITPSLSSTLLSPGNSSLALYNLAISRMLYDWDCVASNLLE